PLPPGDRRFARPSGRRRAPERPDDRRDLGRGSARLSRLPLARAPVDRRAPQAASLVRRLRRARFDGRDSAPADGGGLAPKGSGTLPEAGHTEAPRLRARRGIQVYAGSARSALRRTLPVGPLGNSFANTTLS